jgi:outer membrane lipoprotein-sorting protein
VRDTSLEDRLRSATQLVRTFACSHSRTLSPNGPVTERWYFLADGRYRQERENAVVICDGSTTWIVPKGRGDVFKQALPLPPLVRMLDPAWLFDEHDVVATGTVVHNGRPAITAEAKLRPDAAADYPEAAGVTQHELIIDDEYGFLLWRLDKAVGLEYSFADVHVNEPLDESLFRYESEPGRKVREKIPAAAVLGTVAVALIAKGPGRFGRKR